MNPAFKLSYDVITHKKVYDADCFVAIPEGKKCFAVFQPGQPVCIYDSWNQNIHLSTAHTLVHGTTFYYNKKQKVFCMEDVLFHQNESQDTKTYKEKLQILVSLLHTSPKNAAVVVGMPVSARRFQDLIQLLSPLQYKIAHIQYRYFDSTEKNILCAPYFKPRTNTNTQDVKPPIASSSSKERVFHVTADLQADIYNLYELDKKEGKEETFFDNAFIPDYKTSVMMNRLFRRIKENENLDSLQESDDEEEFEDDRIDKYVDLTKQHKMVCTMNYKFKKWVPLRLYSNARNT